MKKITILGRGNAGCLSAMHFYKYRGTKNKPIEIEMIYDPEIAPVPTGQGTLPEFSKLLWTCFGTSTFKGIPMKIKTGIMYENWGTKKDKFLHEFPLGTYGLHISPVDFQNHVCKNLQINFKEKKENILTYDQVDADYIIDCRGTPNDFKEYDTLINPINCALLANLPEKNNDVIWTRCVATSNGWTFYIPLPETTSVGYLFNSDITSKEEAEKDFKNTFEVEKINQVFPFKQYIAKNPIIDSRVFLNGNRLFFLEPLEATAMSSYMQVNRYIWDFLFNDIPEEKINEAIKTSLYNVQDYILWHYGIQSKFNSPFWKYANDLYKKNKPKSIRNVLFAMDNLDEKQKHFLRDSGFLFAQWGLHSFKNWKESVSFKK